MAEYKPECVQPDVAARPRVAHEGLYFAIKPIRAMLDPIQTWNSI